LYERLTIDDIQCAADATNRRDGYVSMEVSPHIADDTRAAVSEGRRLWLKVQRPNLMVKIPATPEGLPAIEQLIAVGINVNVTLIFSRAVCRRVAHAYLCGLESRARRGVSLARIASVASMFVSRIDTLVDRSFRISTSLSPGKVAIANARLAYQDWKEICSTPRWRLS
jgi:transaldolase